MNGSDEVAGLLVYTHAEGWEPPPPEEIENITDRIDLNAWIQRRFPEHSVGLADLQWLLQTVEDIVHLPSLDEVAPSELNHKGPPGLPDIVQYVPDYEYIYLVLAWLAGTASKQVVEQAIKTAADLLTEWMRSRRSRRVLTTQVAYILGPNGEVLKKVEVGPEAAVQRKAPRRRR